MLEDLPRPRDGAAEEELERAVGDGERAASEVEIACEVGEVIADLQFAELVGTLVVVLSELTDGSHIGLAGTLGEPGELEILEEAMAESGHGRVLSEKGSSEGESALRAKFFRRGVQEGSSAGLSVGALLTDQAERDRVCREAASLNQRLKLAHGCLFASLTGSWRSLTRSLGRLRI